jgi:hypothetical protein
MPPVPNPLPHFPHGVRRPRLAHLAWRTAPLLGAIAALLGDAGAAEALQWKWSFARPASQPYGPITAMGLLTTTDTPDGDGFYTILSASGNRNGVAIAELLPLGSSIPGNSGFFSDNLLRQGNEPMTKHGFNVRYEDGSFSNFFTATFLNPVQDMDFHSVPPSFATLPDTELTGVFQASPIRVPAPVPALGVGLALAWSRRLRRQR